MRVFDHEVKGLAVTERFWQGSTGQPEGTGNGEQAVPGRQQWPSIQQHMQQNSQDASPQPQRRLPANGLTPARNPLPTTPVPPVAQQPAYGGNLGGVPLSHSGNPNNPASGQPVGNQRPFVPQDGFGAARQESAQRASAQRLEDMASAKQPPVSPRDPHVAQPALGQPGSALRASLASSYNEPSSGTQFNQPSLNEAMSPNARSMAAAQYLPSSMPAAPKPQVTQAPEQTRRGRGLIESDQQSGGRVGMSNALRAGDIVIDELLREVVEYGASDMHLSDRSVPMIRKSGSLKPMEGYAEMNGESLKRSVFAMLTQKQRESFESAMELDFAYQVPNGSRYRVNLYQQRDAVGAAFRVIPSEIKPLESLGVPSVVGNFAGMPRGLVLVTGPTGSGKSTTLASIIDLANRTRADHIMTVEDPIEFLHDHKKSLVNQREVGTDTWSFAAALKHVLRQDPDIILVGEMRDLETISVALTAAETGHLVFATLHTQDAAQSIDRVIDVFPPEQQEQIRVQLAAAIQGVVCQTLCKRADGKGRVVATEVLVATPAIRNLIREGKTHQIYSTMQSGTSSGMHTMDQHLADLTKKGEITYEVGLDKCHSIADYNRLTGHTTSVGMDIANAGMGGNLGLGGSH